MNSENGRNGGVIVWVGSGETARWSDGQEHETSVPVWVEEIKDPNLISNALARQGIHHERHGGQIAANTNRNGLLSVVLGAMAATVVWLVLGAPVP